MIDAPDEIVQSTFYGESSNLVASLQPYQPNKNHIQPQSEWLFNHSSGDEDHAINAPAIETFDITKRNIKSNRLSKSKRSAIQAEKSLMAKGPIQAKDSLEQKSNRKRKSAQIAANLTKKQLNDEEIGNDEGETDVYDFDEDDFEPVLKKKRRIVKQKKKKSPQVWPRIKFVEKIEEKRPPKVYTIRVKAQVGARAKTMSDKSKESIDQGKKSKIVSELYMNATEPLENGFELLINTSEHSSNEVALPSLNLSEKSINADNNVSETPPSTVCPLKLPKQIIENIAKINEAIHIDSSNHSNVIKTHRKYQNKDIVVADSTQKLKTQKKPQPRKLYTQPDPEFDGIDMDQADTAKNQCKGSARETLISSSCSIDLNDKLVTGISVDINATHSCRTSSITDNVDCDSSQGNLNAMSDSTNDAIVSSFFN